MDNKEKLENRERIKNAKWRQRFHIEPPDGWLNDPNGLCQLNGIYHAFFQYSPFNAEGGVKMWGHYTSKDMIDWEYQGVKLYPDLTVMVYTPDQHLLKMTKCMFTIQAM